MFLHTNRRVGCCRFGRIGLPHRPPLCNKVDQAKVKSGKNSLATKQEEKN
jgi:hypothetical protein